jgi:CPA2 family monovalent cation:H+ antiporter-2
LAKGQSARDGAPKVWAGVCAPWRGGHGLAVRRRRGNGQNGGVTGVELIRDLAVVWLVAGAAAWVCVRLRLSAVVGYLVAGMVIGPHTPPFALVRDQARVELLAELGLVFLVFSIGLNLSLRRFQALGLSVAVAAAGAALLVLQVCRLLGWALGWSPVQSLFLAGTLMVSSSAIISRVLEETQQTHERPGQLALGMTLLEDLIAVVMLTVLTSMVHLGGPAPVVGEIVGGLVAFVVLVVLLTLLVVPRLLGWLTRETLPEVRTLVVGGLLLGLAWAAVRAGYSLALGAFVFGMIVGGTRYRGDLERVFAGLQQIFGAVFFVAIGMQVNVREAGAVWPWTLGLACLAWVLRPAACAVALMVTGVRVREALQAGLTLTPLGEFSFVLAQVGVTAGIMPSEFYAAVVGAALLTSLAAPWLGRRAERWSRLGAERSPEPAREWLLFYAGWLDRLRSSPQGRLLWGLVRRPLGQVGLWTVVLSALVVTAPRVWRWLRAEGIAGGEGGVWLWGFGLGVGLLALPLALAWWRSLGVVVMVLAEAATRGSPRQKRLQPLLEGALRVVATAAGLEWLALLLPPGVSLAGSAGVLVTGLLVAAVVLRKRLIRWQSRLEWELRQQWPGGRTGTTAGSALGLSGTDEWDLDVVEVELPGDSAHAGRSLAELKLRERFGCTIVGIERQGWPITNPGGEACLYPHDKLLVLGAPQALEGAINYLRLAGAGAGPAAFPDLALETVVVPEGSPAAGRTLRELDWIRRFGIQVAAIGRAGMQKVAPTGWDRIESGDELLVLGTHEQIKRFTASLSRSEEADTAGRAGGEDRGVPG